MLDGYIFYVGDKYQVEFYLSENGRMLAKEQVRDAPVAVKAKLAALVKIIAEEGSIFDKTKFRLVDRKERIYEFKPNKYRFFNFFFDGAKIIITNGYRKRAQKVDRKELKKAIQLKKDYISRVERGGYYE